MVRWVDYGWDFLDGCLLDVFLDGRLQTASFMWMEY